MFDSFVRLFWGSVGVIYVNTASFLWCSLAISIDRWVVVDNNTSILGYFYYYLFICVRVCIFCVCIVIIYLSAFRVYIHFGFHWWVVGLWGPFPFTLPPVVTTNANKSTDNVSTAKM